MTFPTPLHSNCPSPTIQVVAAPPPPGLAQFGSLKRSHNLHYPSNFVLHKGNTFYVGDYVYFTSLKGPPLRAPVERKIQVPKSSSNSDDPETSPDQPASSSIAQASPVIVEYRAFGIIQKFTINRVMKKVSLLVVLPGRLSRGILQPEDFTLTAETVEICADQIMSIVCSPVRRISMSVPITPSSSHYFHIYPTGCVPHLSASVQANLHPSVSAGPSTEMFPRSVSRPRLLPRPACLVSSGTAPAGPLFGSCQDAQTTSSACSPFVEPDANHQVAGSSRCATPTVADSERAESAAKRIKLETAGNEVSEKFEVANVLLGFHKSPKIM